MNKDDMVLISGELFNQLTAAFSIQQERTVVTKQGEAHHIIAPTLAPGNDTEMDVYAPTFEVMYPDEPVRPPEHDPKP